MNKELQPTVAAQILDEEDLLSLAQLCRLCRVPAEQVLELVDQGIIEPRGREHTSWVFHVTSVRRVRCALHLRRDLGVNWAGAALAVELLEELVQLRARLDRFER